MVLPFCPRTQTSELPYETPSFLLKVGIHLGFGETAHLPSPKLTLTLASRFGQNDGLGEG